MRLDFVAENMGPLKTGGCRVKRWGHEHLVDDMALFDKKGIQRLVHRPISPSGSVSDTTGHLDCVEAFQGCEAWFSAVQQRTLASQGAHCPWGPISLLAPCRILTWVACTCRNFSSSMSSALLTRSSVT